MFDTATPSMHSPSGKPKPPIPFQPWEKHAATSKSNSNAAVNINPTSAISTQSFPSASSESKGQALFSSKKQQLLSVTKQLAILVETGVDIAEAIAVICDQLQEGVIKNAWQSIQHDISSGKSLSFALSQQKNLLGAEYTVSLSAGEASGRLAEVLKATAEKLERDLALQWSTRSALAYPCVLCVVAFAVINSLIWFVLPQFEKVFDNMGFSPPWITQVLLEGASTIRSYYLTLTLFACALIGIIYYSWNNPRFSIIRDKFLCRLPVIGKSYRYLATSGFLLLCGNTLRHGVPLLESLQLCARATSSPILREILRETEQQVLVGQSLSHTLARSPFFPPGTGSMITMAEKSGSLDKVMITTGEFFEKEGVQSLQQALKLLEPILIVIMGALVALVIASVMLPMMDANSAIR